MYKDIKVPVYISDHDTSELLTYDHYTEAELPRVCGWLATKFPDHSFRAVDTFVPDAFVVRGEYKFAPKQIAQGPSEISREKLNVFAAFVDNLTNLSKCERKHVAAIAVNSTGTQVLSIGLNGGPAGGAQCLCGNDPKYSCIHAEAQCIAKCTDQATDKIMICSLAPCITCAALIVNSGYKAMYYLEEWKTSEGLRILRNAGVKTGRINMEGVIV